MYKINSSERGNFYAIPSRVNDVDCDLIVLINDEHPNGLILGTRNENGIISQKGYIDINPGDRISFHYQVWDNGQNLDKWYLGDMFITEGALELEWKKLTSNELYKSIRSTCIWNDYHFEKLVQIKV